MNRDTNLYRLFGMGIAAIDLPLSSTTLEIVPNEKLTNLKGTIGLNPAEHTHKGVDASGKAYESVMITSTTITAEWIGGEGNRTTPPNVRKGERVKIYRYADSDQFFWEATGLDRDKRNRESVVYTFDDKDKTDNTAKNPNVNESIKFEISAHEQSITLTTPKTNGAVVTYDIQINYGKGIIEIADSMNNIIQIDSPEYKMLLLNGNDSKIEINKKDINIFCHGTLTAEAEEKIHLITKEFVEEIGENKTSTVGGDYTNNTSGSWSHTGGSGATLTGNGASIDLNKTGTMSGDKMIVNPEIKTNAGIDNNGDLKNSGKVSTSSIHADTYENLPPR